MASYKVIQDIEAEDKLVGPLTLRQFIYAGIVALCLYLGFISITAHVTFFLVILVPVALIAGFFAFPWKLNQPTETWALAMIKFFFKPRKRIWDQSGVKEIVTITAPKVEETNFTNNLSQGEVRSRLKSLASILDSRGWAIKNSSDSFNYRSGNEVGSDRLVAITTVAPSKEALDSLDSDDILDDGNNPTAQRFSQMINRSSQARYSGIKEKIRAVQNNPLPNTTPIQQTQEESPVVGRNSEWFIQANKASNRGSAISNGSIASNHTQAPNSSLGISPKIQLHSYGQSSAAPAVTQPPNPVILNFASNNDSNVATLARQINKQQVNNLQNEVVVQLH